MRVYIVESLDVDEPGVASAVLHGVYTSEDSAEAEAFRLSHYTGEFRVIRVSHTETDRPILRTLVTHGVGFVTA